MKAGAFFSGGKDSTYAIYLAKQKGFEIECLLSVYPHSEESHLFHHPNLKWTFLQSKSMKIPQLSLHSKSVNTNVEISTLEKILKMAKNDYGIESVIHGGISSQFQKQKFEDICNKLNLKSISPLWGIDAQKYYDELISSGFSFIVTAVSSGGLNDFWLGKKITKEDIENLTILSEKYGFNLNLEGGEAETFVINCPLFSKPIKIEKGSKYWDGYRGRFEIMEASLDYHA